MAPPPPALYCLPRQAVPDPKGWVRMGSFKGHAVRRPRHGRDSLSGSPGGLRPPLPVPVSAGNGRSSKHCGTPSRGLCGLFMSIQQVLSKYGLTE